MVHGSGSSGRFGIFVYSRADWQVMNSTIAPRLPPPERGVGGKTRAAFFLATHGHFAGITTAKHMPAATYDCLFLSVMDSVHTVVESLNNFQPDRLTGYSSGIATLADLAQKGTLRIRPRTVLVSGERFTERMAQSIERVWDAQVYVTYSASEAPYMAVRSPARDEMTVMDDLNILEVLDEARRPVPPGGQGHAVETNLFNYTLPLIRYELADYVTVGDRRTRERLYHHPEHRGTDRRRLAGGHAPRRGRCATSDAAGDVARARAGARPVRLGAAGPCPCRLRGRRRTFDDAVGRAFQRWLNMKDATRTTFRVGRLPQHRRRPPHRQVPAGAP